MGLSPLRGLSLFAFVSGTLLPGCSGKANSPGNGGGGADTHGVDVGGVGGRDAGIGGADLGGAASRVPSAGGANLAGQPGSLANAGSASVSARNPDLVAPPDDTCERFHLIDTACTADPCPPWPCDQTVQNFLGTSWCNVGPNCFSGFDCVAAHADSLGADLANCFALYRSCTVDKDCPDESPYCVLDARYTSGSCDTGAQGMRCRADDDCLPGSLCVAVDPDGRRGCTSGAEGSICNVDAECKGKRCIHEPGVSINGLNPDPKPALVGVCSTGKPGSRCFKSEIECPPNTTCSTGVNDGVCLDDARCLQVTAGLLCTSGNLGEPCAEPSDCKSNHCQAPPEGSPVSAVCAE